MQFAGLAVWFVCSCLIWFVEFWFLLCFRLAGGLDIVGLAWIGLSLVGLYAYVILFGGCGACGWLLRVLMVFIVI